MWIYCVAFLIVFSHNVFAYDPDTCFPGNFDELSSPSGTQGFIWKEPKDQADKHHLFYSIQGAEPRELLTFGRSLCIYWSPDEKYFSITDNMGSNVAETYIYKVNDLGHRINVTDLLPGKVANYLRKGVSHGYVVGLSWNKTGLFVRVFGDRNEEPRHFDVTLKCSVEKSKWGCTVNNGEQAVPQPRL
ncbi:MAG TPA: hypothetical protein VEM15_04660 [Thermodesulfobacteriota bacterium]|nr:hypothetical protein [Thermodesulfobacteriota bacterium]